MTEGHKHIMSILKDVRSRLSNIPEVPEKLLLDLEDAECTLNSTSNLSHFMKMSINRCIEYSHVREHHPLSPNLVSVKLLDALNQPVACVTSIDPAHVLEVKPLPSDLCTHVMADVQWLQENILLLLSNAVKYSNPGHTTLSLRYAYVCLKNPGFFCVHLRAGLPTLDVALVLSTIIIRV